MTRRTGDSNSPKGRDAVNGILGGLEGILGKIADLADKAEAAQREGSFNTKDGKEGRFHVGFNIRTMQDAGGERSFEVEPFGDVTRDRSTGEATVTERREPPTDVFEESDHVLVVVEMPGIGSGDASFTVDGDVLTIAAESGSGESAKRYHKELLLPASFTQDELGVTATNGVFELRFQQRRAEAG